LKHHLRSNLVAYLALFVAIGGTAYAGTQITSAEIKNGTIREIDAATNTFTGKSIRESKLGEVPKAKGARSLRGLVTSGPGKASIPGRASATDFDHERFGETDVLVEIDGFGDFLGQCLGGPPNYSTPSSGRGKILFRSERNNLFLEAVDIFNGGVVSGFDQDVDKGETVVVGQTPVSGGLGSPTSSNFEFVLFGANGPGLIGSFFVLVNDNVLGCDKGGYGIDPDMANYLKGL
jgi:hypothetical protein